LTKQIIDFFINNYYDPMFILAVAGVIGVLVAIGWVKKQFRNPKVDTSQFTGFKAFLVRIFGKKAKHIPCVYADFHRHVEVILNLCAVRMEDYIEAVMLLYREITKEFDNHVPENRRRYVSMAVSFLRDDFYARLIRRIFRVARFDISFFFEQNLKEEVEKFLIAIDRIIENNGSKEQMKYSMTREMKAFISYCERILKNMDFNKRPDLTDRERDRIQEDWVK